MPPWSGGLPLPKPLVVRPLKKKHFFLCVSSLRCLRCLSLSCKQAKICMLHYGTCIEFDLKVNYLNNCFCIYCLYRCLTCVRRCETRQIYLGSQQISSNTRISKIIHMKTSFKHPHPTLLYPF